MNIFELIEWLLIFIIGSLIVNFLIYPESFNSFKSNFNPIINSFNNMAGNEKDLIKIEYPQVVCSAIEKFTSNSNQVKESNCYMLCIGEKEEYYSYKCEEDKLICLCKQ